MKIQVSSEQIAGAGRNQPQRNPGGGQTVGHGADGAVPAGTDDKIDSAATARLVMARPASTEVSSQSVLPRRSAGGCPPQRVEIVADLVGL